MQALELSKLAQIKCKALEKFLISQELSEFINPELSFACGLNLAAQFQKNGLKEEAFREYESLLKTSNNPNNFLVRVNIGNLHFEEGSYRLAIKMYKMALDMAPVRFESLKFKIMKNIGKCHVQLREFPEAVIMYQDIISKFPDFETAFNLILCLYVLGDKHKIKNTFSEMIKIGRLELFHCDLTYLRILQFCF